MILICGQCKKEYKLSPAFVKRGSKCCSIECWNVYKRKLPKFVICGTCKKSFENVWSQRTKRFCSVECYAQSKKGKYPANLKGKRGTKPRTYHLRKRPHHGGIVYDEWRMAVWKRDNFTCQHCKKTANELKKLGIKINADHIKPYCNYPELRYELSNGRTLCMPCHKKTPTYGSKARYF